MDLRFNLREIEVLADRFDEAEARGRDLTELMDRIGMAMETSTQERFETETAPDGGKWQPSIRARVQGGRTLTLSGRGANSITHRASSDQVEIGTNVIYMAKHQEGGPIRAKTAAGLAFNLPGGLGLRRPMEVIMPKREFVGLGGDDEETIVELAEDFFAEPLGVAA